eukprot:scaffold178679_cov28-Tisochrysis_lutea.AAC.1
MEWLATCFPCCCPPSSLITSELKLIEEPRGEEEEPSLCEAPAAARRAPALSSDKSKLLGTKHKYRHARAAPHSPARRGSESR